MDNNTLLISYKTLTQSSELNENIDVKLILPLIKEVQEMELQTVLGALLFERLKADVFANTLAGFYKELLNEYCKPVLINALLAELPFKLNYRFTNTGVVTRTSENTTPTEFKDLQKLSDQYKAKKVFYSGKMIAYILKNKAQFLEYNSEDNFKDSPKNETYEVGIYL